MRIARVLRAEDLRPIVALERDGALYDVALLEQIFGTERAPGPIAEPWDFHSRVVALAGAGLAELDDRLLAGDRPTEARLHPGSFVWLAPIDTDRALFVQLGGSTPALSGIAPKPTYWIGNARGFLGHDASVPFPHGEEDPDVELCLGAVLGEDLRRAACSEAERAILGYAVLGSWTARNEERLCASAGAPPTRARDFGPQLGPVLVTKEESGDVRELRSRIQAGADAVRGSLAGAQTFTLAESIAFVSAHIELRAGDIIGAPPAPGASFTASGKRLPYNTPIDLTIERIGKLTGRPMRGPEPAAWRSDPPREKR
ncbi:MAG: fumarylacetoacetate hydrolase family protein [Polyangiaceae bacterium]|nr:fumarylacetoacetate hydrolase family protein [Polyangiaceae bacterium]